MFCGLSGVLRDRRNIKAVKRLLVATPNSGKLVEIMAAIKRWGMGREMKVTELEQLALSIA